MTRNTKTTASWFLVAITLAAGFVFGVRFLQQKISELTAQNYHQASSRMVSNLERLIDAKRKSTLAITLALASDQGIKEVLRSDLLSARMSSDTRQLSQLFRSYTKYKNVWIQVINHHGVSVSRSWVDKYGDSLFDVRLDVREMIANPRVMETISTGKFTMSFKSMVPIFYNNELLGMVEVITHFNSIVKELEKSGIESMVLVDKRYRQQLGKSITNTFVDDYYVTNFDVQSELVGLIENIGVEKLIGIDSYLIYADRFITINHIKDINGDDMGFYLQFRPLHEVQNGAISRFVERVVLVVVSGALIALLIVAVIYHSKRSLLKQKEFFQAVMDSSGDAIIVTDLQRVIDCNQAFQCLFSTTRENGQCVGFDWITGKIVEEEECLSRNNDESWQDYFARINDCDKELCFNIDGQERVLSLHFRRLLDSSDLYLLRFLDITAQKAHESALTRIANYDSLTGLPNRILMHDRLHRAMAATSRNGTSMAFALIDLDGFKEVNDTYGHDAGDKLLTTLAHRMQQVLREGDTVARLGGDEFVAILIGMEEANGYVTIVSRLLAELATPVHIRRNEVQVTGSIGVAIYSQHDELTDEQLIRRADQAMYHAKLGGKNQYHLYHEHLPIKVGRA